MHMQIFAIGQRWISAMEPELGVGLITEVSSRMVRLSFPAVQVERQYAIATAPLQRLEFKIGDTIKLRSGAKLIVDAVEQDAGALTYRCGERRVAEKELDDLFSFSSPRDRLLSGFYDANSSYNLRVNALMWRARHQLSPAFGFIGGRISLIPHQLYVAAEVAGRQIPRVLLSDQIGLGKTIEAILIIHRLLLSRRIERVLILVPESLLYQWFVECLRRFNLVFRLIDPDYIAARHDQANLFADDQLVLMSLDLLRKESLLQQALQSGWDMIIIDEAHHLREESPEYRFTQQLAGQTAGLLLLTATPEQLGQRGHFARLQLLDPSRYYDYTAFRQEAEGYGKIANLVKKLLRAKPLRESERVLLRDIAPSADAGKLSDEDRAQIIRQIADRYGVGRVIFRNTRAAIPDFPQRKAHLITFNGANRQPLIREFQADCDPGIFIHYDYRDDPRILWLAGVLKKQKSKILLICHTLTKALAIDAALRKHLTTKTALFHENMTLLQRDRSAAWFAEKDGAQLLICSEIGSEGRNFQFAHHLVLFDLPRDPELLEQRIGRLDRIGQKETIHIYVPHAAGSPQERLARWYHEGFDAFERNAGNAFLLNEKFGAALQSAAVGTDEASFNQLVAATRAWHERLTAQMEKGRDRLLELNSFDGQKAALLQKEISALGADSAFQDLMLQLFDHFGVAIERLSEQIYLMSIDHHTHADFPFPSFRKESVSFTFDRRTALSREEIEFLTPDHPTALGAIDLLLASEKGNAVFANWESADQELLLEAIYIVECLAPMRLHIERFFPATPIRVLVNHHGSDLTAALSMTALNKNLKNAPNADLLHNPKIKRTVLPQMMDASLQSAKKLAASEQKKNHAAASALLNAEIDRLQSLGQINANISQREIDSLRAETAAVLAAMNRARLRLDAVRFIVKG
ncbi:RNA polymerase-associated protein RapA [candidate division KSB1 bacterium]|nr:RNA polymerase-associated protein RapA [candidate division KSB1 bacterium]RQW11377.1 MAG: RNA polymerase-associated protein RapA [candidate division KSB1 bacterium]